VGGDVPIDSEVFLVTDFVNLKIKPAQSFISAHRGKVCVRVFIWVSACTCMSICVYTVFLKKDMMSHDILVCYFILRRQ
jgi:glucan phosphoethanolaminetransferase (alkaline phosphatase superfamily)